MKKVFIAGFLFFYSAMTFAQSKETGTESEAIKQYMSNKDPMPALSQSSNEEAVKTVLSKYNSAIAKLDVSGTENLFSVNSKIFESGGSEGNYTYYLEHHLKPELEEFTSFKFFDYRVDIQIDGKYAFATETYGYTIIVAKDNREVKRKGVATSVLKKENGKWKIMISHNSSRKE